MVITTSSWTILLWVSSAFAQSSWIRSVDTDKMTGKASVTRKNAGTQCSQHTKIWGFIWILVVRFSWSDSNLLVLAMPTRVALLPRSYSVAASPSPRSLRSISSQPECSDLWRGKLLERGHSEWQVCLCLERGVFHFIHLCEQPNRRIDADRIDRGRVQPGRQHQSGHCSECRRAQPLHAKLRLR